MTPIFAFKRISLSLTAFKNICIHNTSSAARIRIPSPYNMPQIQTAPVHSPPHRNSFLKYLLFLSKTDVPVRVDNFHAGKAVKKMRDILI